MRKNKTREKKKDIKALDKSAVIGQRMKTAFLRSKRNTESLMDDRQNTPTGYAVDQVEFAADDLGHDAVNAAASGTKLAIKQGRNLFQRQWEKRASEGGRKHTTPAEQAPASEPVDLGRQIPWQGDDSPSVNRFPQHGNTFPQNTTVKCPDADPVSTVERGREYARKQTAKRMERTRQIQNRMGQSGGPRQIDAGSAATAHRQTESAINMTKQPAQPMRQAAKETENNAKTAIKNAKRTVKNARRTVKTAPRAIKTTTKTTNQAAVAGQKTAQATARAAKATAHAARTAAKTTAVAAKSIATTAKAAIASVKSLTAAIASGGWVAVLVIVLICLVGLIAGSSFGIFFSGEDSGTGLTMPAVVREINQEYLDKLDAIKAGTVHDRLEMVGSRAVWREVLAVYAVKTTTDPDTPQEVATVDEGKKALMKEIFWAMNEIGSRTETATTTQTKETDDGAGNIIEKEVEVTETVLYITVTHKTAEEMADAYHFTVAQRMQLAELLDGKNSDMWSAVLYGLGAGDREIVAVAISQLGNIGGEPYWAWYGFGSRVDWCACFVSWCANECGYLERGVIPKFASCAVGIQWFQTRGQWQDGDYEPRPGDLIFFDWNDKGMGQDGIPDHVGIVQKMENGIVYTVEGNSGDACRENRYAVGHYEIYGYGTPAY